MLTNFIESKLKIAKYQKLGDSTYYGEIKGLKGLWANAKTLKACRDEMQETLEEWLTVKIRHGDPIHGLTLGTTFSKKFSYA